MDKQLQHPKQPVCLLLICGLPGAGKTTLTKEFLNSHPHLNSKHATSVRFAKVPPTIILVPFDEIIPEGLNLDRGIVTEQRKEGCGSCGVPSNQIKRSTLWKEYRQEIHRSIDQFLDGLLSCQNTQHLPQRSFREVAKTALELDSEQTAVSKEVKTKLLDIFSEQHSCDGTGGDEENPDGVEDTGSLLVVLDDNMFYRSMRYEYYQLARKYGTGFAQIYLQCSVSTALARNQARKCRVAEDTIATMATKFEVPDPSKAPWEELSVTVDAKAGWAQGSIERIWCVVEQALASPAPPYQEVDLEEQEKSREISLASVLHQADVALRKSVAETMTMTKSQKQLTKAELRHLASVLNNMRTDILDEVRNKRINLPPLVMPLSEQTDAKQGFHQVVRELFIQRYTDMFEDGVR